AGAGGVGDGGQTTASHVTPWPVDSGLTTVAVTSAPTASGPRPTSPSGARDTGTNSRWSGRSEMITRPSAAPVRGTAPIVVRAVRPSATPLSRFVRPRKLATNAVLGWK